MLSSDRIVAMSVSALLHAVCLALLLHEAPIPKPEGLASGSAGHLVVDVSFIPRDKRPVPEHSDSSESETVIPEVHEDVPEHRPDQEEQLPPESKSPASRVAADVPARPEPATATADTGGLEMSSASAGAENDLEARYYEALRLRIGQVWASFGNRVLPENCSIAISLGPEGALASASARACEMDPASLKQLEAVALMAQPLPYKGFESVFSPTLELNLEPRPYP